MFWKVLRGLFVSKTLLNVSNKHISMGSTQSTLKKVSGLFGGVLIVLKLEIFCPPGASIVSVSWMGFISWLWLPWRWWNLCEGDLPAPSAQMKPVPLWWWRPGLFLVLKKNCTNVSHSSEMWCCFQTGFWSLECSSEHESSLIPAGFPTWGWSWEKMPKCMFSVSMFWSCPDVLCWAAAAQISSSRAEHKFRGPDVVPFDDFWHSTMKTVVTGVVKMPEHSSFTNIPQTLRDEQNVFGWRLIAQNLSVFLFTSVSSKMVWRASELRCFSVLSPESRRTVVSVEIFEKMVHAEASMDPQGHSRVV